jgi:type I restriction enzyme R subunit
MPTVVVPGVTFADLVRELQTASTAEARALVLEQLVAKLRRKQGRIDERAGDEIRTAAGTTAAGLGQRLRAMSPEEAARFFDGHPALVGFLDRVYSGEHPLFVWKGADEVRRVEHGYGRGVRPEDYLSAFGEYLRTHMNEIPALLVVTRRPRDLTRKQLRELALALDGAGSPEATLRVAWVPYADRVAAAVRRILASRAWTPPQRQWLERIGKQLAQEVVVDREALDRGQFRATGGGWDKLNRVFEGRLHAVLGELHDHDAVWEASA